MPFLASRQALRYASYTLLFAICLTPLLQLAISFDIHSVNNINIQTLLTLFIDSTAVVAAATIIAVVMGSLLAYILATVKISFSSILVPLMLLNLFIPSYIHALSWTRLLSEESLLYLLLKEWGVQYENSSAIYGGFGAVWVLAISYFPVIFLAVYIACQRWGMNMQNSAKLFGTSWNSLKIRVNFIRIPVLVSSLIVFLLMFSDFGVPDLFQISMYSTEIFIQISSYYDISKALFLSIPYVLLSFFILWVIVYFSSKISLSVTQIEDVVARKKLQGFASTIAHIFIYLFTFSIVIYPILNLIYLTSDLDTIFTAFQLIKPDLMNSIIFATSVALTIIFLTLYASYEYSRNKSKYAYVLRWIIFLMMILPASLIALSLISVWNQDGVMGWFYQSPGIVVLGVSMRWLPVGFEVFLLGWLFINQRQEYAAMIFTDNWWSIVTKVHLQQIKPYIISVFILCFVLAFNELTMMVLLSPPGLSLLPSRIFSVIHYGPDKLLSAICVIQITVILIIVSFIAWYNRSLIYIQSKG